MEETGDTEEEAISKVRKSRIDTRKVYEYAKKSGYEVSEKEVEERIKKYWKILTNRKIIRNMKLFVKNTGQPWKNVWRRVEIISKKK